MARIVLVRHAKAEPPSADLADHERPLALRGRAVAAELGRLMSDAGITPDAVWVSSATRTQQTWKLVQQAYPDTEAENCAWLYETSPGAVQGHLTELPDTVETVMLVGHEPVMSSTVHWLSGPGSDTTALKSIAQGLSTGTAAVLETEGAWRDLTRGAAKLRAIHSGRDAY